MAGTDLLKRILEKAGIPNISIQTILENLIRERIEPADIVRLNDEDLTRLGVSTLGERIRLREAAKEQQKTEGATASFCNPAFPGFRNFGSRTSTKPKKREGVWTAQFFCLATVAHDRTPTCTEKEQLNRAGLGLKKIKIGNTFTELDVLNSLKADDAFPPLRHCGGYELMRTQDNGRCLVTLPAPWSSKELRRNVGPQARIYIRPIQHSLSTEPLFEETCTSVTIPCEKCKGEYKVQDLRNHVEQCTADTNEPSSLPELEADLELPGTEPSQYQYLLTALNSTFQEEESLQPIIIENTDRSSQNKSIKEIIQEIVYFCQQNNISNPVEILKKAQQEIITGRELEITNLDSSIEGDTNFITVDRTNLLETSMEEISSLSSQELRKTLEVQFYNEQANDLGGPRKEFFRLALIEIQEKYFDNGIRDLLAADYKTVGTIFALSILQNGKIPTFLSSDMVAQIFDNEPQSPAVRKLREGLNELGLYDLFVGLPELRFLLQAPPHGLTTKRVVTMLKPNFSPEGSNHVIFEKEVYWLFIKYLREVAAGRRGNLTLSSILQFVTSTDEEPVLGFKISPCILFTETEGFLPTASTCVNSLTLPRPSQTNKLPSAVELFNLYDYAFSNTYYGLH